MYSAKVVHSLSKAATPQDDALVATLWSLFVAIGDCWQLGDDPAPYRLRFLSFLENRMDVEPLYRDTYRKGAALIDSMVAELGAAAAFEKIFFGKAKGIPTGVPATPLETLQRFIANEFIALRLALGGFKTFGALNYPGYFGGANIDGEPVPYRPRSSQ
jgi:hypothetical protein